MNNTTHPVSFVQGHTLTDLQQVTSSLEVVIAPKLMSILSIIIYYVLQVPVLFLGIGTNILVIVTFIKCGLNDSVTVSFFALSISDLGYCTLFFVVRFSAMLRRIIKHQLYIRLDLLAYVVSYYALFFNDVSILVTVFTAVQKCCCVAIPHLFKNVFTPKRAVIGVVTINCSLLCLYIPLNQAFRLKPTFFPTTNRTVVYLHVLPIFRKIVPTWEVFSRIVLPMSAQGILIICLCIMTYKLKQSVKFRSVPNRCNEEESNNPSKTSASYRLGPNEKRAITAVTVVSAIFVTATLPTTIMYYFHRIFPILLQPQYNNVRSLVFNCQNILIHANAAVNLFVYLKYNTKFKENFSRLFEFGNKGK